jgi:hypothetical protein
MNGKKAKMLRRTGKVDKEVKRMYNTLDSKHRHILTKIYQEIDKNGE